MDTTSEEMPGTTVQRKTRCKPIDIIIADNPKTGKIKHVFAKMGKAGSCKRALIDTITYLLSEIEPRKLPKIAEHLLNAPYDCKDGLDGTESSCVHVIGERLLEVLKDEAK